MTKAGGWWYRTITRTSLQPTGQTAAIMSMIIHQVGNGTAAMFFRQVKFATSILFDVVMLHVGMWPVTKRKILDYRKKPKRRK